ncbi:hypothetical protein [Mesobacillus zeae]|uniref:Uncharacterized protein n=1 Tax=Mesobacillus zeae TaxID=1917180 RepID=A0A398B699_9BACI|nr:hypothetical protein [Mesobacillus zeae]RID83460.1 hypothetical protein D1970_15670 [Mesobacillus zeae]
MVIFTGNREGGPGEAGEFAGIREGTPGWCGDFYRNREGISAGDGDLYREIEKGVRARLVNLQESEKGRWDGMVIFTGIREEVSDEYSVIIACPSP